ncbi:zinc ribbon domain-containing protein [uncultured Thomasclavelia sp.]|uniref:zinc ribbon domain-containing protein n=1 Tax=uncultured Thomasclavelia sp. TaxID=3025759 RepID=UPI0025EA7EDC|nr:zinc ribbon domain-containing protein [uncultured Thomasclavelia sp.]
MKKCPYCKKNIPDSAKVCPHCGNRLEKGYQPMKRTNSFPNYIYMILALILVFSPILTTIMFGSFLNDSVTTGENAPTTPENTITLGPLGNVDASSEIIEYQFNSLDDFSDLVTNSGTYVDKIKAVENDLETIAKKYNEDVSINKDYNFYVTNQNNVYSDITYQITVNDQENIQISLNYDLSGKTNEFELIDNMSGFETFEAMKINDQSCLLAKEIVTLFTDETEFSCFNQVGEEFNGLEGSINNQSLGNYGLGVNESQDETKVAMRILGYEQDYRFRLTYRSEINMDKLV